MTPSKRKLHLESSLRKGKEQFEHLRFEAAITDFVNQELLDRLLAQRAAHKTYLRKFKTYKGLSFAETLERIHKDWQGYFHQHPFALVLFADTWNKRELLQAIRGYFAEVENDLECQIARCSANFKRVTRGRNALGQELRTVEKALKELQ